MNEDWRERLVRLEAKADHRDEQIGRIVDTIEKLDGKVDELRDFFQQAKGAKYVIAGGAAVVGGLSAFLVKLLPFTNGFPK